MQRCFPSGLKTALLAMIKDISELKDLIIFAREQKLKSLKVGNVEFEISELAHIEASTGLDMGQSINKSITASITGLEDSPEQDSDDEDLLFHSSRP